MTSKNDSDIPAYYLQKSHLQRHFDKAACSYNEYAVLQKEVASRLVERLDYINVPLTQILDLGAGTGFVSLALAQRNPQAQIVAADISIKMLERLQQDVQSSGNKTKPILTACADAENLPFPEKKFDLVISSLALQWCNQLDRVFSEAGRVLKPGGLFMFTIFGPDTLKELRECWFALDDQQHVNAFYDMHDLGDVLLHQGFQDPVMDVEIMRMTYPSVDALMKDLKMIGATNAMYGRSKTLTGKEKIRALKKNYEAFRVDSVLPATYELVYGHAWVAQPAVATVQFDKADK